MNEGDKNISHRNKLILIADSSEESQGVVNEYQHRDPADYSNDDKGMTQAESRASQKCRRAQLVKKNLSMCCQKSSSFPVPPLSYVVPSYGSAVPLFHPIVSPSGFDPQTLSVPS